MFEVLIKRQPFEVNTFRSYFTNPRTAAHSMNIVLTLRENLIWMKARTQNKHRAIFFTLFKLKIELHVLEEKFLIWLDFFIKKTIIKLGGFCLL